MSVMHGFGFCLALASALEGCMASSAENTVSGFMWATKSATYSLAGLGEDLLRRSALNDPSAFHDRNARADLDGFIQIVADENDGSFQALSADSINSS